MTALARLFAVILAALGIGGAAASSRVPTGVTSIGIRSTAGVASTVTRPAAVRQIVKWFDALPHFVARPCPLQLSYPPTVRFTFRGAGGSVSLRATDRAPGTCGSTVTYGNAGQVEYAPLADDGFVARVSRLIGVDFAATTGTGENERAAQRDAATILRRAVVPTGSRRLATPPNRDLGSASSQPGTTALADVHAIWKVRESFGAVSAFESAHVPHGAKPAGNGFASGPTRSVQLMFSFPALHGRVSSRQLIVDVTPLGRGWTGIRVDAQDVWIVAREPGEKLPAGVRAVEVRSADKALVRRFTNAAEVARIVRWFDALPVVQPAVYHCPAIVFSPSVTLVFLGRDGAVLATVAGPYGNGLSGPCNPLDVRIRDVAQKPLVGGRFFRRVERLAR